MNTLDTKIVNKFKDLFKNYTPTRVYGDMFPTLQYDFSDNCSYQITYEPIPNTFKNELFNINNVCSDCCTFDVYNSQNYCFILRLPSGKMFKVNIIDPVELDKYKDLFEKNVNDHILSLLD